MGIFRIIIFPARFGVILCVKWFNLAPWICILFLIIYIGWLNFAIFFPLTLLDEWYNFTQLSAVIGPTAHKLVAPVVMGLVFLICLLNILAVAWAIIIFFFAACLAKPLVQSDGYKLFLRFTGATVGGES